VLSSLAIAACLTPKPAVEVDVSGLDPLMTDEERRRLHGALLARLLDEGYALGRHPEAISLALRPHPEGIRVFAISSYAAYAVTLPPYPASLLELTATHAAVDAITHVEDTHDGHSGLRPRVTLEVRGEARGGEPGELYLRLLPIVAAADVSVVPKDATSDWRLCVSDTA
jgi:hypothetical protein